MHDNGVEAQMSHSPEIKWNPNVKLVLADVDETVADLYLPATPEMIKELESVLEDDVSIFFVTGGGLKRVRGCIIDLIKPQLRKKVLIAHCSGAEVWGFNEDGEIHEKPYYSVYEETMNADQRMEWRSLVQQLISEFDLKIYPTMPVAEFKKQAGDDPRAVMMDDRGPQITFEFVNGYDLTPEQAAELNLTDPDVPKNSYDLRIPILERAEQLFKEHNLPIAAKLGGVFALDMPVGGVSKEHAVRYTLNNDEVLNHIGLDKRVISTPETVEIWGDKFSVTKGGSDRHMIPAAPVGVRVIDFRPEDPEEFPEGANIQLWKGQKQLHDGLLEYLQSRSK